MDDFYSMNCIQVTGEPLVHLKEEREEEFATRLNKYHEEVKGAIQYYKDDVSDSM